MIFDPIADAWGWLATVIGQVDDDFAEAVADRPTQQDRPALDYFEREVCTPPLRSDPATS